MYATTGGSGGIPPNPSPETGWKYIWDKEFAEQKNIVVINQRIAFDYIWVKHKDPWGFTKDKWKPHFESLLGARTILEQATKELREAMIMLHDGNIEKPT